MHPEMVLNWSNEFLGNLPASRFIKGFLTILQEFDILSVRNALVFDWTISSFLSLTSEDRDEDSFGLYQRGFSLVWPFLLLRSLKGMSNDEKTDL